MTPEPKQRASFPQRLNGEAYYFCCNYCAYLHMHSLEGNAPLHILCMVEQILV